MKIGILTQPLRNNYGGLLQNYALQAVLKQKGHDVVTIDWVWPTNEVTLKSTIKKIIKLILCVVSFGKIGKPKKSYLPTTEEDAIIHKNVYHFAQTYISSTSKTDNPKIFAANAISENCDAFVVGSDQCWRPLYNMSFLPKMYLDFVKSDKVKKVSYAASFGTDNLEYNHKQTTFCSRLAKDFDLITVREKSGVSLCKEQLGVEAKHVLDPTMLLEKEDYIKLIEEEKEPRSKGTLFQYILDPTEQASTFIMNVAKENSLIPFMVLPKYKEEYRTLQHVKESIDDCVYPSVTAWLRAFMDAEMTIVDSFHGMVFSIIFNKPFWVIGNKTRGMSRFLSLLEQFDLQDRLLDIANLTNVDVNKPIEWEKVNNKRQALKEQSLRLLYNALNNEES